MFTFKQFLLNEDLATDIATLQSQISQIMAKKNQQNNPMDKQLQMYQTQLAAKQKEMENQQKSKPTATTIKTPLTPSPAPSPTTGGTLTPSSTQKFY